MVALRDKLAAERAEALQSLLKALRNLYSDVDTPRLEALLEQVGIMQARARKFRVCRLTITAGGWVGGLVGGWCACLFCY